MWVLLLCSVALVGVFLERLIHFHRATIHVGEFLQGLSTLIRRRSYAEALHETSGMPGPVARVIHAALLNHGMPRADLKAIVQESGQLEVPKLERYLFVISTIAYAAPLIGFLGTVTGLLDAFTELTTRSGYATATDLSAGIYQALITTSTGLAVGIAAFVAHNYLSARVNSLLHDMERGGIEALHLICDETMPASIVAFAPGTRSSPQLPSQPATQG